MSGPAQFRLFGKVEIFDRRRQGGAQITLPPFSRSLLVWLLLHREGVTSREDVAFQLFPDESPEAAFANLRRHIHLLSRKLSEFADGQRWIVADHRTVAWNADIPIDLDLDHFSRACETPGQGLEAAALYRGQLATDVGDEWIEPHRLRFHERFTATCFRDSALLYRRGDGDGSLRLIAAYVKQDPWHEDAVRAAILLRARAGDRVGALQQFERFREELARELGVEPSSRLLAAVGSIRDGLYEEPFGEAAIDRGLEPASQTRQRGASMTTPLGSYSFRGRERDLEDLLHALENADSHGAIVIVAGAPGIGKSRLAKEAVDILSQRNARPFRIVCSLQSKQPYGPILELLALRRLRGLADRAVGATGPDQTDVPLGTKDETALSIAEALKRLDDEQRTFVVVEDAQWIDAATLELLRALRNLDGSYPSFILLYRTGSEESRAEISELRAMADLFVELEPLDRDSVKVIAANTFQGVHPTASLLDDIADLALGNPLFAQELARYSMLKRTDPLTPQHLPRSVAASVQRRLSEFAQNELRILEIAATVGETFDVGILADVSGQPEPFVRQTVRKARDLSILKAAPAPGSMSFAHALLHEAILSRLLADERAGFHRAIASELAGRPARSEALAEIAYHWQEAGERLESCKAYLAAGDYAREIYALRDALDWYDCAKRQNPDDDRLGITIALRRAETQLAQGLVEEARVNFETIVETMDALGEFDPVLRATVLLRLSACEWSAMRRHASSVWASRALDTAADSSACTQQRCEALVMLARAAVLRGDADEALEHLDSVGSVDDPDLALSIAGYRGLALAMLGNRTEAIAVVTEPSAALINTCKNVAIVAAFRQNQGVALGWLGRLAQSRDSFDAVVAVGRRARNRMLEAVGHVAQGHMAYYLGDLRLARSCYDTAASLGRDIPGISDVYCAALGLKIAAATEDRELAGGLINERLFAICEESDDVLLVNTLTGALIDYAASFGDVPRARALLKSYLANLKVGAGLWYAFPRVLYLADESDVGRALALARSWAEGNDNPVGDAFVASLLAAQSLLQGRLRDASSACLTAIPIFESLGMRLFVDAAERLESGSLGADSSEAIRWSERR